MDSPSKKKYLSSSPQPGGNEERHVKLEISDPKYLKFLLL
jgi:hypothetical protein